MNFSGVIPASITPLNEDCSIDIKSFEHLINYYCEHGAKDVLLFGSTGEGVTISMSEKIDALKYLTKKFKSKIRISVGMSCVSTNDALNFINNLECVEGIFAYMITPPFYIKPTQNMVLNHFQKLSSRAKRNIIFYNIPSRTGIDISAETFVEILSKCKNVISIKNCGQDSSFKHKVDSATKNGRYSYLIGDDDMIIQGCSIGANGIISASACLLYKEMANIFNLCKSNKYQDALDCFKKIDPIISAFFSAPNPVLIKYACSIKNKYNYKFGSLCKECLSEPFLQATEDEKNIIKKILL